MDLGQLVAGVVGAVTVFILERVVARFDQSRRRRVVASALSAEAKQQAEAITTLLTAYPGSRLDRLRDWLSEVGSYDGAGAVFLAHVGMLHVLDASLTNDLAHAYTDLRVAAGRAGAQDTARLPFSLGPVLNLKADLGEIEQRLRRVVESLHAAGRSI